MPPDRGRNLAQREGGQGRNAQCLLRPLCSCCCVPGLKEQEAGGEGAQGMQQVEQRVWQRAYLQGQGRPFSSVPSRWRGRAAADIQQICGKEPGSKSDCLCSIHTYCAVQDRGFPPNVVQDSAPSGSAEKPRCVPADCVPWGTQEVCWSKQTVIFPC